MILWFYFKIDLFYDCLRYFKCIWRVPFFDDFRCIIFYDQLSCMLRLTILFFPLVIYHYQIMRSTYSTIVHLILTKGSTPLAAIVANRAKENRQRIKNDSGLSLCAQWLGSCRSTLVNEANRPLNGCVYSGQRKKEKKKRICERKIAILVVVWCDLGMDAGIVFSMDGLVGWRCTGIE